MEFGTTTLDCRRRIQKGFNAEKQFWRKWRGGGGYYWSLVLISLIRAIQIRDLSHTFPSTSLTSPWFLLLRLLQIEWNWWFKYILRGRADWNDTTRQVRLWERHIDSGLTILQRGNLKCVGVDGKGNSIQVDKDVVQLGMCHRRWVI